MTTAATKNGVWLKAIATLTVAAIVAVVTLAWTLNGRVTANEGSIKTIREYQKEMRTDIKELLRRVKPAEHP